MRSWTHLERQRGGFGFLGGPGETQIEADRRLIQERMTRIERDLETVTRTRGLHRKSRRAACRIRSSPSSATPTPASRRCSTGMTAAEVFAENMLFATLDPTSRAIKLPHGENAILSDTVGFISDLPTMLVAAFRATLEDVIEADVLLHVRDVSHGETRGPGRGRRGKCCARLGIDPGRGAPDHRGLEQGRPALGRASERASRPIAARREGNRPVLVSAVTGEGIDTPPRSDRAAPAAGRPSYLGRFSSPPTGRAELALRAGRDPGPPNRSRRAGPSPRSASRPRRSRASSSASPARRRLPSRV